MSPAGGTANYSECRFVLGHTSTSRRPLPREVGVAVQHEYLLSISFLATASPNGDPHKACGVLDGSELRWTKELPIRHDDLGRLVNKRVAVSLAALLSRLSAITDLVRFTIFLLLLVVIPILSSGGTNKT